MPLKVQPLDADFFTFIEPRTERVSREEECRSASQVSYVFRKNLKTFGSSCPGYVFGTRSLARQTRCSSFDASPNAGRFTCRCTALLAVSSSRYIHMQLLLFLFRPCLLFPIVSFFSQLRLSNLKGELRISSLKHFFFLKIYEVLKSKMVS